MDNGFIPFLPRGGGLPGPHQAPTRLTGQAPGEKPGNFQPVAPAPRHACAGTAQPAVTLQRDGERITHIRLQCSCGQVFELACEY